MSEDKKQELPFELIVGDKSGQIHSGDVAVRWCVSPELVARMEQDGVEDPHVLLSTADKRGNEMQRQLVPLSEMRTYVRFTRAGSMLLHGWIVDAATFKNYDKKSGRKYLKKVYLDKTDKAYDKTIIYHDERYEDRYVSVKGCIVKDTGTSVEVVVPDGVFGKEPHPAIKWFVNLWHGRDKVVDQCQYRRRFIFAFTLKWIPVLVAALLLLTFRLALVVFMTSVGYPQAIRWKYTFKVFDDLNLNYFINDKVQFGDNKFLFTLPIGTYKDGTRMYHDFHFLLPVVPLAVIFATLIGSVAFVTIGVALVLILIVDLTFIALDIAYKTSAIREIKDKVHAKFHKFDMWMANKGYWPNAVLALSVISFATLLFIVVALWKVMLLSIAAILLMGGLFFVMMKISDWVVGTPTMNDYTEIRELLCPKDEMNRTVEKIPSKYKTVRLYFLDFKNKVCKPMQQ